MRDIKFRAWDKRSKKLRDVESIGFGAINHGGKGYPVCNMIGYDCIEQKRMIIHRDSPDFILDQYTGIKDKNGEEIYEGDILEYKRSSRLLRDTVMFSDGAFWCGYHDGSSTRKRIKLIQPNRVEIIGNIHENPELIS